MTRFPSALSILALLCSAPLAAQAVRDFQLPPAPAPTAEPRVQGPVDTDAPVPVRPRAIATDQPPTAPASTPPPAPVSTAQPTPTASTQAGQASGARLAPRAAQGVSPANSGAAEEAPPSSAIGPVATQPPALAIPSATAPGAGLAATPAAPPSQPAQPARDGLPWVWIALAGAGLAAALGALLLWRRRGNAVPVPEIAIPQVPRDAPGAALAIAVEAVRMDRSVLNATVGYRVTVRNRTAQALAGLAVEADLVSASRDLPSERQLASPDLSLTPRHAADRLAPGQSLRFEGQVRLPLAEAKAIWQGNVGLLVPLLRVRAVATDAAPVATTLVIGRAEGSATRPQPFRLDEPPRSYAPLAQRVLDAAPARA